MAAISQTTCSNAFSWMKVFEFKIKFHWNTFLGVQLTICQHWFRWWLGPIQVTGHFLNQCWPSSPMHIYAAPGGDELIRSNEMCTKHLIITFDPKLCYSTNSLCISKRSPDVMYLKLMPSWPNQRWAICIDHLGCARFARVLRKVDIKGTLWWVSARKT